MKPGISMKDIESISDMMDKENERQKQKDEIYLEMLEALKRVVNEWKDTPNFTDPCQEGYDTLQECVRVIQKAEGQ